MTKFGKCAALYAVLFLMMCCVVLAGCHKAKPQNDTTTATTKNHVGSTSTVQHADSDNQEESDGDDLILEIETHATERTSVSTGASTTRSNATSTRNASSSSSASVSSSKKPQQSNTTTETAVTTTRTTQAGWTPDLGKKPKS